MINEKKIKGDPRQLILDNLILKILLKFAWCRTKTNVARDSSFTV